MAKAETEADAEVDCAIEAEVDADVATVPCEGDGGLGGLRVGWGSK